MCRQNGAHDGAVEQTLVLQSRWTLYTTSPKPTNAHKIALKAFSRIGLTPARASPPAMRDDGLRLHFTADFSASTWEAALYQIVLRAQVLGVDWTIIAKVENKIEMVLNRPTFDGLTGVLVVVEQVRLPQIAA